MKVWETVTPESVTVTVTEYGLALTGALKPTPASSICATPAASDATLPVMLGLFVCTLIPAGDALTTFVAMRKNDRFGRTLMLSTLPASTKPRKFAGLAGSIKCNPDVTFKPATTVTTYGTSAYAPMLSVTRIVTVFVPYPV